MKALYRLQKELDVKRFIKNQWKAKNTLKFLTTKTERRLAEMQADRNVLPMMDADRKILAGDISNMTKAQHNIIEGNSSAFTTSDYEPYINMVERQTNKNYLTLTEREEKLMIGVCKKEDEILDLNNMGLGKALAELKIMKAAGTGLYADQSFT